MSKLADSLKHLGEIQVNDWDFMALLNQDISEVDVPRSLRRLAGVRVMEWDFRTVLPVVSKIAHTEVDVIGIVKRTAAFKVMEWDFRSALTSKSEAEEPDMQALIGRLKDFLEYVVVNLIDEPGHAQIKVREIAPRVLRFKLVLVKRDVAMLIGKEGHTASAIRRILKEVATRHGAHALLLIHSHEDEAAGLE